MSFESTSTSWEFHAWRVGLLPGTPSGMLIRMSRRPCFSITAVEPRPCLRTPYYMGPEMAAGLVARPAAVQPTVQASPYLLDWRIVPCYLLNIDKFSI